jgi:D-serine deaminase-like pyridoxal phosphate-dependent protein
MNRGMTVGDFDTPALAIDLDVLEHNIQRLQDTLQIRDIANRPYVTTHGIPGIALAQLAAGATGIACQSLGEAMMMAGAGISDILVTGSITGPHEVDRLLALVKRTRLAVVLDDVRVAQGVSEVVKAAGIEIGILVQLATTMQPTGVWSPRELAERTRGIARLPGVGWRGIMLHPSMADNAERVSETLACLEREGMPASTVSGGGTQAIGHIDWIAELTEFRAGTYALNDKASVDRGAAVIDDCALSVVVTVTSRPAHDRATIDGGNRWLFGEPGLSVGYVWEYPGASIYRLDNERGYLDLSSCTIKPEIGERLRVIPRHAGETMSSHRVVHGLRDDEVEVVWEIKAPGGTLQPSSLSMGQSGTLQASGAGGDLGGGCKAAPR